MTQTALTREQVMAMEPGQKLDELINLHFFKMDMVAHVPYSTEISAAREVEEWFAGTGITGRYAKRLKEVILAVKGECSTFDMVYATPEQRCKAALLAVLDL